MRTCASYLKFKLQLGIVHLLEGGTILRFLLQSMLAKSLYGIRRPQQDLDVNTTLTCFSLCLVSYMSSSVSGRLCHEMCKGQVGISTFGESVILLFRQDIDKFSYLHKESLFFLSHLLWVTFRLCLFTDGRVVRENLTFPSVSA